MFIEGEESWSLLLWSFLTSVETKIAMLATYIFHIQSCLNSAIQMDLTWVTGQCNYDVLLDCNVELAMFLKCLLCVIKECILYLPYPWFICKIRGENTIQYRTTTNVQWEKSNNSQQYLQDKNPPVRWELLWCQIWQLQRMHEIHESNQG